MNENIYGAYHDLVINFSNQLVSTIPDQKERIESIIFQDYVSHMAQELFGDDGRHSSIKNVGQYIKEALFPDNQPAPRIVTSILVDFARSMDRRSQDCKIYWSPFYQTQQSEAVKILAARSATIFDPNPIPGFKEYVAGVVWRTKVRPEVENKIAELMEMGIKTSDDKMPMAVCLYKQMHFVDDLLALAKEQAARVDSAKVLRASLNH